MDGTITQQGSFVQNAAASAQIIPLRSGVDWMRVYNVTEAAANNANGNTYFWQRGMTGTQQLVWYHGSGANKIQYMAPTASAAFTYIDTSLLAPSAPVAITGLTNEVQPVVTSGLAGFANGAVVRMNNVTSAGGVVISNVCGVDFTVSATDPGVTFTVQNALATAPGVAGTAGFAQVIAMNSTLLPVWYPAKRTIANISNEANAVVTTTVDHNYVVGQQVRINVPFINGAQATMTQINGQVATITAVTASTFTINIDTTGYTAFAWPSYLYFPATFPEVIPMGENTAAALAAAPQANILSDAEVDTGFIGMVLNGGTGLINPAGSANDVIFWTAGKSFNM